MSAEAHSEASNSTVAPLQNAGVACSYAIKLARDAEHIPVREWSRDRLIDFNHWAAGVGLFASSNNTLDHRLLRNPETVRVLLSVLDMLTTVFRRILKVGADPDNWSADRLSAHQESIDSPTSASSALSFSPWSSADESTSGESDSNEDVTADPVPPAVDELCKDAEHLIDRLVDLGVVIRRSGLASRLLRADSSFNDHLYHHLRKHLELSLQWSNFYASTVIEDRRTHQTTCSDIASSSSTALRPDQVHLIHANLRRRHRFAFARKRASTLAFTHSIEEPMVSSNPVPDIVSRPRNAPVNILQDNGTVGESKALSTQETATAVDIELDRRVEYIATHAANEDTTDAASTALSACANILDYPKAPRASNQRAFKCPCCCQVLNKATGKDRKKWRKHLAQDIYPYTCPIIGCTSSTIFFIKRKDWKAHLREHHKTVSHWICSICGDDTAFYTQSAFEKHVQDRHATSIDQKHLLTMVELARRESIRLPSVCPICNVRQGSNDQDTYLDHLGDCIHGFSLASLPWNDTSEPTIPQLRNELVESITAWITQIEIPDDTEHIAQMGEVQYLTVLDIDLSSKDASDSHLPNEDYFDDNDKVSRISEISAKADVSSTTRSGQSLQTHRSEQGQNFAQSGLRRQVSDDSEKAGRIWAREVDDPWWPCILSLDGGGIRGYSTLLILQALMREIWKCELKFLQEDADPGARKRQFTIDEILPCHYFDFMYGTSSGGLIATLLGRLRLPITEALEAFRSFGEAAFGRRRSSIPLATKYYHEPLENFIRTIVKSKCRDHVACDGEDLHPWESIRSVDGENFDVDRPRVCQSCCLTATHETRISEAYLLRTYNSCYDDETPNWLTHYNNGADMITIWQAVRATLATPFFFEMLQVEIGGEQKAFKDGGIRENNPSGAALSEFYALYHDRTLEPAVLLSIGAGRPDTAHDGFASYSSGPVGRVPLVGKFLEKRAVMQNLLVKYTEGEKQHSMMRELAHGEHSWYKRLSVSQGLGGVPMDDWTRGKWHDHVVPGGATLTRIEQATSQYLERQFYPMLDSYAPPATMLRQTAEKLVRQRRAREQLGGPRWDAFAGKHLHTTGIDLGLRH